MCSHFNSALYQLHPKYSRMALAALHNLALLASSFLATAISMFPSRYAVRGRQEATACQMAMSTDAVGKSDFHLPLAKALRW